MRALWLLTKKNIKLLLRSKSSALIVIFAPLILILILGFSYNTTNNYALKIGVYSTAFSDDVNSFITLLQEKDFEIVKYDTNIENCVRDMKSGLIHTCISLPESFQIEDNSAKEAVFYTDPSRVNLVWVIENTVKEKFGSKSQEISAGLAQDLIDNINEAKTKVDQEKSSVSSIKENTAAISATIASGQEALSSIDLTVPATEYDETSLIAISADLNSSISSLKSVSQSLGTSNQTSAKNAVESVGTKLSSALDLINSNTSNSVATLINNLKTDLSSSKQKMTSASNILGSSKLTFDQAVTQVNSQLTSLDGVNSNLNVISSQLAGNKVTDSKIISSPLNTRIETVSQEGTYFNYLFSVLLVLVIMFASLPLGTTLVMMEKNSPAFFRNFFLPIRKSTFIAATYFTNIIFIIIQIAIIMLISLFFLKDAVSSLPAAALILFLAASVFTFLGMAVGYLFRSEETGMLASISLGSLILFLSGVIIPIESVSPALRQITALNPFVLAEKLIRQIFIFKQPLSNLWTDLLILLSYAVILFLVILIMESILYKHLLERFVHNRHKHHRQENKLNPK